MTSTSDHGRTRRLLNVVSLVVALVAGAVVFLPFAVDTSPLDAVILRVPGDQGNWWHALIGAPFFLAFPMIWLWSRTLFGDRPLTSRGRWLVLMASALSACGTVAVEVPFLLHLAGTSEWQRSLAIGAGLGIGVICVALLLLRGRRIPPTRACLASLTAAYLANASLCLIVYSDAGGSVGSRSGWLLTLVIVWPMAAELIGTFVGAFSAPLASVHGGSAN